MEERLNMQGLVDLMIQNHHLSAKDAEAFVKEFFNLIIQGLEEEQQVRIKGLGTFKLTAISPRESVDVNTGERIKIQGHTRISFVQDISLKEVINKPFAHFETVVLNEGTHLEEELPVEEELATEEEEEEEERENFTEESLPVIQQEPLQPDEPLASVMQEPTTEEVNKPIESQPVEHRLTVEDIIAKEIEEADRQYYQQKHFKKEKRRALSSHSGSQQEDSEESLRKKKIAFWIISLVALFAFCSWALWQLYQPVKLVDKPPIERVAWNVSSDSVLQQEKAVVQTIPVDTVTVADPDVPQQPSVTQQPSVAKQPSVAPKALAVSKAARTHTVAPGETLCRIALKYYGSKDYWTYLYKSNEDVIGDPDLLSEGTVLKIPELVRK